METSTSSPTSSGEEEDPSLQTVTDFDFISFLEERNLSSAAETSFPHVEASQDSGVREGMVVETPLAPSPRGELDASGERYWLATIVGVHGPLLRLAYVGTEGTERAGGDLWHDLSKNRLFPLGWCQMNKISLEPPESIKAVCPHWQGLALQYLEDIRYETICMHHIDGEGVTPVDRLKEGMMLELQDELVPDHFWPVSIKENKGGMLVLKYEGLEMLGNEDFKVNLFYSSNRLFPYKYSLDNQKKYILPVNLQEKHGMEVNVDKILQSEKTPAPSDLIVAYIPESHTFELDTFLEIIPPMTSRVELAKVDHIWDEKHFRVSLVSDAAKHFLCHQHSDNIFPVGWSEKHLPDALKADAPNRNQKIADESSFPVKVSISEGEFQKGQKLDVLYKDKMRSAEIFDIKDSIIILELDSDVNKQIALVPVPSTCIFPFGWSITNFLSFMIPKSFNIQSINASDTKENEENNTNQEAVTNEDVSSWCPEIYFNYQCYSASFLSKARLASLPKAVGPGTVYLVMKKVLELIIGSSYKSGSVLRRLECKSQKIRKNFILECMKGKSRVTNLKANIEIPTRADQVNQYCREVCQKVGACPYLVSATRYDKECPANCQSKPKSDFHAEEQSGILFRNRGRRGGRKRRHFNGSKDERGEDEGSSSLDDDSDETMEPPSTVNSRSASPENDSNSNQSGNKKRHGRKEWENILPRSEIRTRGAKLPNFKLHLKIRPSKKEQRVIESNSLRESIGYDKRPAKRTKLMQETMVGKRTTPMKLKPAFQLSDIIEKKSNDSSVNNGPPPIRVIILKTNPDQWTCQDTARFLAQTTDCSHLAQFMVEDEIDGQSFMLLNYPTAKEFWSLTVASAIHLCQHVESVKLAYLKQFRKQCL